jgi:hypothetical protein
MFRINYFDNGVEEVSTVDEVVYWINKDVLEHIKNIEHDGDEYSDEEFLDMVDSGFKF